MLSIVENSDRSPLINEITEQTGFGETLHAALDYLDFRVHSNFDAEAACTQLARIINEQEKFALFQKYFPDEWQASRSSRYKPGYYELYSERANEFLELVNQRLFPILSGWNDDPEMEFEAFGIFSVNIDLCCEEIEFENLRPAFLFALVFFLSETEIRSFIAEQYRLPIVEFPEIRDVSHADAWTSPKCGRTELYRIILRVIDHTTGNPWFDTTNCQYQEEYSWDEASIDYLTETFREAEAIWKKIDELDALIEADPRDVLAEMVSFWNTGSLQKRKKKRLAQ